MEIQVHEQLLRIFGHLNKKKPSSLYQMSLHHPCLYCTSNNVVAGIGVRSNKALNRGDFVGFYSGKLVKWACYETSKNTSLQHVSFAIEGTDYVVSRNNSTDVVGFINEVPKGMKSNVVAVPIYLDAGNAVGYFAANHIKPHTELLVHYGNAFNRDYEVGVEASVPKRLQRADSVLSSYAMKNTKRYCAPRLMFL